MELNEFVQETLTQIIEGVSKSQKAGRAHGGYINPHIDHSRTQDRSKSTPINFDIALKVTEDIGGESKAKIEVATLFNLEAGGGKNISSSTNHHISFKVDVMFPVDEDSEDIATAYKKKNWTVT